jgi:flavin-dependent dehydrogenase
VHPLDDSKGLSPRRRLDYVRHLDHVRRDDSTMSGEMSEAEPLDCDVAVIGGGFVASMAALMLRKRGLRVTCLETRGADQPLKAVVGEALTEGTSVFLRHELDLGDWLHANAYRKFGFDFVTQPRSRAGAERPAPRVLDECHELLLSLTQLEAIPGAFESLIPTFHVNRPLLDAELRRRAQAAGAEYWFETAVERVELDAGGHDDQPVHRVAYSQRAGDGGELRCRFVLDASGRRRVLGKQLGICQPMEGLETASIWNRFTNVRTDPEFWSTFHGIDRRRHTIHWTGAGFWFWWIHIDETTTSVGVSFDKHQHQPDIKADDRGFWEMAQKFPALLEALAGAEPVEPFSYYAHLAHKSEHWLSTSGYALIGDASAFADALYSVGIEMACRQLVAVAPLIEAACAGERPCETTVAKLNEEHQFLQDSIRLLNKFKYEHAWHQPHVLMQTALYELAEIAELYHLQAREHWTRENLDRHYRLQWGCPHRRRKLVEFMTEAANDGEREFDRPRLLAKGLIPGRVIYSVTWPLWKLPKARPYFFILTRTWGYMERLAQRWRLWPDFLTFMAGRRARALPPLSRDDAGAGERGAGPVESDHAVHRAT